MALPKGKYYSIIETADLLGISEKTIRRRIKSGTITAKKVGRTYQVYIPEEDLPKTTIKEDKIPPKDIKADKSDKMTGQQSGHLIDVLIKQLDEKDKLIKELNDRIKEAHILASGRLLGNGNPEKEEDEGEVIYATESVASESGNVVTEPTTKKEKVGSNITRNILYVLISLATLGLLGLMAIQSGLIKL